MKVFKKGDLVYSFASKEFYIILKTYGGMSFRVYSMDGSILEVIDITITHVTCLQTNNEHGFKNFYIIK